jgi:hypothetical protein
MADETRGRGRPPGSQNKVSSEAKSIIAGVAGDLGGQEGMLAWVKADPANERLFWSSIYTKLVASSLEANGTLEVIVRRLSGANPSG